jgi:hypothetical protein
VRALIEEAVAHAIETGHIPTLVVSYFHKAHFEVVRGDAGAARRGAEIAVKLSQENAITRFAALAALASAWPALGSEFPEIAGAQTLLSAPTS